MGNKYYKLLVMFQTGEKITRHRLLRLQSVTEQLIDEALDNGYIVITTPTSDNEERYVITELGKQIRDEKM